MALYLPCYLYKKRCLYDNPIPEAQIKIIKIELVKNERFESLKELKIKLVGYVNGDNNFRIHSSLGYLIPVTFKQNTFKKVVSFNVDNPKKMNGRTIKTCALMGSIH